MTEDKRFTLCTFLLFIYLFLLLLVSLFCMQKRNQGLLFNAIEFLKYLRLVFFTSS